MRSDIRAATEELVEVKHRLVTVELGLASVRREIAVLAATNAHRSARIDRLGERVERIELRLGLADAHAF